MKHIRRNKYYYLALALAALVALAMNMLTTLKGDEFVYALVPGDMDRRCDTLAEYVRSMPAFYSGTNGRLADIIERLFASVLGKSLFNVLNAAMLVGLVEGLFALACGRRRDLLALMLVLLLIGLAFPYPGETLLWMAGSFNYLWSAALTLWLLVALRRQRGPAPARVHAAVFACALLVGWLNESATLSCVAGLALYYALNPSQFTGVRRTALAGQLAGLCVILLSPALWRRLDGGASVDMSLSVVQLLSRRLLSVGYMSLRFVTPAVVAVLAVHTWRRRGWRAVRSREGYCMVAGALLPLLGLGMIIERPYTLLVCLCMAVTLRSLFPALRRLSQPARLIAGLACAGALWVGASETLFKQWEYRRYDRQVHALIARGPAQCVLPASEPPVTSRWIVPDVYDNTAPGCAYRTFYARYYGKDNVQFLPPELMARYENGCMLVGARVAPLVSNAPAVADTLLAFPGHDFALIPLKPGVKPSNGTGKLRVRDMSRAMDRHTRERRYWLGSLKEYVPFRPYFLAIDGRVYQVVTGEVDERVTEVELHLYRDKRWHTLTFTRND